jgi:hypothetical protein
MRIIPLFPAQGIVSRCHNGNYAYGLLVTGFGWVIEIGIENEIEIKIKNSTNGVFV